MARLLIIDDDRALIVKQVRHIFPAPLHTVEAARTAAKGLECVRSHRPDVILLDLRLPDSSGLEVHREDSPARRQHSGDFYHGCPDADTTIEAMQRAPSTICSSR